MSKTGWIVLVAAGLVAGLSGGVLLASGDGEDKNAAPPPAAATASRGAAGEPGPGTGASAPVDPDDVPLRPREQRRVERAALALAGGGTVTEVDRSDDPGEAYEVEVVTGRGEIDVALDQDLRRVDNNRYDD
jgi:hypothetical protein